ncbi:hypothetical protein OG921_09145 [Aldersonia sp. NBC_00410]|uniref:hypothetical protein n=1 Tax=Aldersonia sp. NBC_00410 TaxID=2975954 RepID=UPI00224FC19E|nr:hypothetical protein [Aldersonia sp. NBC_00410]MCX5043335.1 hypothetical protein [Aldersonia sp. NBC_00410]
MSAWIVALLVWVAAGARVGRVLVRPATVVRMAIVVAVAAVAGATTVAVPDVAQALDELVSGDDGANGASLSATLGVSLWVCAGGAVMVIAIAAWPIASRNLRPVAAVTYAGTAILVLVTCIWSVTVGWVVVACCGVFTVITGLRNLVWSPLGRGIAIFTAATAFVTVLAVLQVFDPPSYQPGQAPFATPGWAWSVAAVAIAVAAVWILVEVWIRARLLLRRTKSLHRSLTDRFPEVVMTDGFRRTTTVLRASDQVAHIMDAMYLQSGGGIETVQPTPPPESSRERAVVVARWARDPVTSEPLDAAWVAPPKGMSTRRWVVAVARAYSATT